MRLTIALGLLPLVLLAGCQSEAQRLASARTETLNKCNADPTIKAGMPGMDTGRFCTCLTNKIFEGRSVADIAKLDDPSQKAEVQRIGMEGAAQCMAEQVPAAAAPTPAAPAATPQPTQNLAAETVEEAADEVE